MVAIARTKKAKCFIASSRKHVPATYQAVTMSDMQSAISFARRDIRFILGNCVMKRRDGWPMGGHMSASATTVTLDYDVAMIYKYKERLKKMKWQCGKCQQAR